MMSRTAGTNSNNKPETHCLARQRFHCSVVTSQTTDLQHRAFWNNHLTSRASRRICLSNWRQFQPLEKSAVFQWRTKTNINTLWYMFTDPQFVWQTHLPETANSNKNGYEQFSVFYYTAALTDSFKVQHFFCLSRYVKNHQHFLGPGSESESESKSVKVNGLFSGARNSVYSEGWFNETLLDIEP